MIDCTVCPVRVNRADWDLQRYWYSPKHGKHCIKYLVIARILDGQIVWVSGGVGGSVHDLTVLRESQCLHRLLPYERFYGDKGFIGECQILCPFKGRSDDLTYPQRMWNRWLNPYRTRIENSLLRIHKFNCLNVPWRGEISNHPKIFTVCSQIAAIDIKYNPILYYAGNTSLRSRAAALCFRPTLLLVSTCMSRASQPTNQPTKDWNALSFSPFICHVLEEYRLCVCSFAENWNAF